MLPFDIYRLLPKESIKFGNIKIPKYGSLTPLEQEALNAIDDQLLFPRFKAEFCKILIQSRVENVDKDLDLNNVPIHLLDELYEFGMNEARQWITPSEESDIEEGEKKEYSTESSSSSVSNTPI